MKQTFGSRCSSLSPWSEIDAGNVGASNGIRSRIDEERVPGHGREVLTGLADHSGQRHLLDRFDLIARVHLLVLVVEPIEIVFIGGILVHPPVSITRSRELLSNDAGEGLAEQRSLAGLFEQATHVEIDPVGAAVEFRHATAYGAIAHL